MLLCRRRKTWVRARNGRDSPNGVTTLFLSVAPVNLELGCRLDELGDVVAAEERPGTLPSSGRAVGGLCAEKSRTPPANGVGSDGQGSLCCRMGKLESPKGRGKPALKGLWLRGWVIQDFGQGVDARRVGRIFCCGGTFFEGWRHMLQLCQFVFVHVGRFGALDRFA